MLTANQFGSAPPNYDLDREKLAEVFKQNPKAIIINSPHNPTGRVFNRDTLQFIADLCIKHNTIAITDEIDEHMLYAPTCAHRHLTGHGRAHHNAQWADQKLCRNRLASGCFTALSDALRTAHDFMTICAPAPKIAAITALSLPESFYSKLVADYTERRRTMMNVLAEVGFKALLPEGAYYVMADYSTIQPDMF